MEEIKVLLKKYGEEANITLEEIMGLEDSAISQTLVKSMRYTLFSGGKRLRPILTGMVAEMIDGDLTAARKVGAAIELIHTYSLIHDDLPSMDDDDYRRGKATNHNVFGAGIAILAGDGLLTYAFNVLSRVSLPPEKVVKIIELISNGAGYNGMVGGQVLDLEAENQDVDLESLVRIHRAKTGALFRSSILAGAICGDVEEDKFEALDMFSNYLGITFQIVDDILDVVGDEGKLGKSVGRDQELNKSTYPDLLGLSGAKKEAERNAGLAKDSLLIFGERAENLRKLVDYILIRQS